MRAFKFTNQNKNKRKYTRTEDLFITPPVAEPVANPAAGTAALPRQTWHDVPASRKRIIGQLTVDEHSLFVAEHGRRPVAMDKVTLIDKVYELALERGITQIQKRVLKQHINKILGKLNRGKNLSGDSEEGNTKGNALGGIELFHDSPSAAKSLANDIPHMAENCLLARHDEGSHT
ncbi:MAG: hypothetical protein LBT23_04260 [Synergistaceae bacterium]|jgi:hypothetical protein|nr:hypothetical protein [Synergistaceae bacterium]